MAETLQEVIFTVRSVLGKRIRLTKTQWEHIRKQREMHGQFERMQETLSEPDAAYYVPDEETYHYYRRRCSFMKAARKSPIKSEERKRRTQSQKIAITYDRETDVLSLTFGRPTKAEAEEIGRGIYARYAWQTGRLVEICILGFSQRFNKQPQEISVPEYTKM